MILCASKNAYPSMAVARRVRDQRQPHERMRLYAYKCQDERCPHHHITKVKPPVEALKA